MRPARRAALIYGQKAEGALFIFKERNEIKGKLENFWEWSKGGQPGWRKL